MFDPERTYDWVGKSGVKWARCQTGWGRTERTKGEFDFSWLDRVVDQLLARGVQPWFNVGYGNQLYTPQAPHYSAVGWVPHLAPDSLVAWQRYITKLATHFSGRVSHWEIWNEPNVASYWQPSKPSGGDYAKLVAATARIIRRHAKDARIIGFALAGLGDHNSFVRDACLAGIADHIDIFSFHPYRPRLEENYAAELDTMRALLHRFKPDMPLWQGENGAPSEPKGFGALGDLNWTEETQAKWLLRRILLDRKHGIEMTSYFLTVDLANYITAKGVDGRTNFKGVLRATDYQPKQSYFALQNVCSLFNSQTTPARNLVTVTAAKGVDELLIQTAAFERKGFPLYAWWASSKLPDQSINATARIKFWSQSPATLEQPIWIDLRTGAIAPAKLDAADAPVTDSPIVLTDRRAL
jgi:hypothetical protein